MHPTLKIFFRIFIACIVIILLAQPFNWYCQLTQSCKPFYLTYHFPKKEGQKNLQLFITAQSKFRDIDFYSNQYEITTVANRKNIVKFTLRNNSKKITHVFPKMAVVPELAEKYITKYDSPSLKAYRLKPKETLILNFEFEINDDLEKDVSSGKLYYEDLRIDFKI